MARTQRFRFKRLRPYSHVIGQSFDRLNVVTNHPEGVTLDLIAGGCAHRHLGKPQTTLRSHLLVGCTFLRVILLTSEHDQKKIVGKYGKRIIESAIIVVN